MLTDLQLAQLALKAYDEPNLQAGHAQAWVGPFEGFFVVAYAGTNGLKDGIDDILMVPWRPNLLGGLWVHLGFWRHFMLLWKRVKGELLINNLPVIFIGHSLGGTSACYAAAMWRWWGLDVAGLFTFGTPRCCSNGVIDLIKTIPGKRFVRDGDQVTWGGLFGYNRREATELKGAPGPIDHPLQGYIDAIANGEYANQ